MIVDLQVDLETADGELIDPAALIAGAKSAGMDGVLVTKDDDPFFDPAAYREAGAEGGVAVFRGAKIASNHGMILCILPADAEALADGWAQIEDGVYDANSVMDAVEERGGVTVALRPYDRDVAHPMGDHLFSLQGLAACEVQNGHLTDIANDLALEAASNMEMPCVGTSGARGTEGLGRAATLLRGDIESETDLCDALRTGDCWPVTFSDTAPRGDGGEDRGRRGGGGGRGRGGGDGRRGRGGRDGGGGRGGRGRGGRDGNRGEGRDGNRSDARPEGRPEARGDGGRGEARGDNRGNRRRGGRGRTGGAGGGGGRGRSGPRPDDFGNRAAGGRTREVAEDIGNRVRNERIDHVEEDIGNRLAPGQPSPYRPVEDPVEIPQHHDDDDDGIGNR